MAQFNVFASLMMGEVKMFLLVIVHYIKKRREILYMTNIYKVIFIRLGFWVLGFGVLGKIGLFQIIFFYIVGYLSQLY